jgi:hypothetical protein
MESKLSFMRGVVESAIRNMSPEDRQAALQEVTSQVVAMMSEDERVTALVAVIGELARSVPAERIEEAFARFHSG